MSIESLVVAQFVARFENAPAVLDFGELAQHLGLKTRTSVARQFERGTLPVRVILVGSGYGVLLVDLILFLTTGLRQEQQKIERRKPRNPHGRFGNPAKRKVGRPSHAESAVRDIDR